MNEIKLDMNGFLDAASLKSGDKNNKASSKISSGTSFKELMGSNVQLMNSKNRNTEEMPTEFAKTIKEDNLLLQLSSKDNSLQELQNNLSEGNSLSLEDIKKLELLSKVSKGKSVSEFGNRPILENTDKLNKEIDKIMSSIVNLSGESSSVNLVQNLVDKDTDKITEVLKKLVDLGTKIDILIGNKSNKSASELDSTDFLHEVLNKGHSDGVISDKASIAVDNKHNYSTSVNLIDRLPNKNFQEKVVVEAIDKAPKNLKNLIGLKKEVDNLIEKISDKLGSNIESKMSNKASKTETYIVPRNIDKSSNTSLTESITILTESITINNSLNNIMQLFNVDNKIEDTTKAISSKDNESINGSIKEVINLKNEIHREIQLLKTEMEPIIDKIHLSSNMSLETVPKEFPENNIQFMNSKSEITEEMSREFGKVIEDDNSLLQLISKDNNFIPSVKDKLIVGDALSSEDIKILEQLSKLSSIKSSLELSNKVEMESIDKLNKEIDKIMSSIVNLSGESSSVNLVQNLVDKYTDKITEVLKKLVDLGTKIDILIGNKSNKSGSELDSTDFLHEVISKGHSDGVISDKASIAVDNKHKYSTSVNLIDRLPSKNFQEKVVVEDIDKAPKNLKNLIVLKKEVDNLIEKISNKLGSNIESKMSNKASKTETDIIFRNIDKPSNTSVTENVNINNSLNNIMQLFNVDNKIEDTTKAISSKDNESINDSIKEVINLKNEIHREIQLLKTEVKPIIDRIQLPSNMSLETVPKEFSENNIELMNSNSEITEKMLKEFGGNTQDGNSLLQLISKDNSIQDLQKKLSEGNSISSEDIKILEQLSKISEGKASLESSNKADVDSIDKLNKDINKVTSNTINFTDKSSNVDLVQNVVSTNTDKITEILKKLVDLETKIDGLIGNISDKSASELDSTDFLNALLSKTSNKVSKAETDIASENIDKSSNTSLAGSVNVNNSPNNIIQLFNVNNKIEDATKAISTKDNESINDSIKELVNLKSEIHREIQLLTNEVKPIMDRIQLSSNMSLEAVPKEFSDNNIQLMNSKSEIAEKMLKEIGKVTEDYNSLLQLISKDNSSQDLQKKLSEGNSLSSEDIKILEQLSKLSEGKSSLELSNKGDVDSIGKMNKDINNVISNTINFTDKASSLDLVQNVVSTNTDKITEVLKKLVDLGTKIDVLIGNISDKSASELDSKDFLNALISKGHSDGVISIKASKDADNKNSKSVNLTDKFLNVDSIEKLLMENAAETDIASENIDKSSNTSLAGSVNVNNSPNNIMQLFNVNNKIEDTSKAISTKDNESINDSIKELVNLKSEIHREIQLLTNEVKPIIDRIHLSSNISLEAVTKEFSENNIQLMNSKSEITEKMLKEIGKVTEDDNSLLQLISKDINKVTSNTISISDKSSSVDLVQNLVDTNTDEIVGKLKKLVNLENKIDKLIENISSLTTESYKNNNNMNRTQVVNTNNNNLLMQSVQQEYQRNINKKVPAGENLIENKIFNNSLEDNQLKGPIVNDEVDLLSSKNEHSSEFKNNNSFNSENKFLKGLLEDNKDIKFDKINTLMGQFIVQNQSDSQEIVAAPKVIDKSNFTSDIIKSITYMETKDIKNMIVKINPKELGEIYIKITAAADGIMKANISANSRETFNLLNAHIQDLNNSLNNSQIKIQHIDINIYNGDTTFFSNNFNQSQGDKNNSQSQNHNNVSYINSEEEPAVSEETIYEDNKLNTLA